MFNMPSDNKEIKTVAKYTYLGQEIFSGGNQNQETKRRMKAGWATFSQHKDIPTEKALLNCLKPFQPVRLAIYDVWKRNMVFE